MDELYLAGFEQVLADTPDGPSFDELADQTAERRPETWLKRPSVVFAGAFVVTLAVLGASVLAVVGRDDTPPAQTAPSVDYVAIAWSQDVTMVCDGMDRIDNRGFDTATIEVWGPSIEGFTATQATAPDGTTELLVELDANGDGQPERVWGNQNPDPNLSVFRHTQCVLESPEGSTSIEMAQPPLMGRASAFRGFVALVDADGSPFSVDALVSGATVSEREWRGTPVTVATRTIEPVDDLGFASIVETWIDTDPLRLERQLLESSSATLGSLSWEASVIERRTVPTPEAPLATDDLSLIWDVSDTRDDADASTTTSLPDEVSSTSPTRGLDLGDALWVTHGPDGVVTDEGRSLWKANPQFDKAIARDRAGGIAYLSGSDLWWFEAGATEPQRVATGAASRLVEVVNGPDHVVASLGFDEYTQLPMDGTTPPSELAGVVSRRDDGTEVWSARNGWAIWIDAPLITPMGDDGGTGAESPATLYVANAAGDIVVEEVVGTSEEPWV